MYNVGEILYLVSNKSIRIIPARVNAITITKTMSGEEISHQLEFADAPGDTAALESLGVEAFNDVEKLRAHMLKNAQNAINNALDSAVEKTQQWTPPLPPPKKRRGRPRKKKEQPAEILAAVDTGDVVTVTLDDGTLARVHV